MEKFYGDIKLNPIFHRLDDYDDLNIMNMNFTERELDEMEEDYLYFAKMCLSKDEIMEIRKYLESKECLYYINRGMSISIYLKDETRSTSLDYYLENNKCSELLLRGLIKFNAYHYHKFSNGKWLFSLFNSKEIIENQNIDIFFIERNIDIMKKEDLVAAKRRNIITNEEKFRELLLKIGRDTDEEESQASIVESIKRHIDKYKTLKIDFNLLSKIESL